MPTEVSKTSSTKLKPVNSGFFKTISWDKLKIKPITDIEFEIKYNNKDKLSHSTWENADAVAKSFMPVKNEYVEGYKEFINKMTPEWFEANKEAIENNMKLDNPNYATESGWGFEKFKEGLTDGKLGIQHRIWFNTLMEQAGQGTPTEASTETQKEEVIQPIDEGKGFKPKITAYNLLNYLHANKTADDVLSAQLSSPVQKDPLFKEPSLRRRYVGMPKEVHDAQANLYNSASKGDASNAQFSKFLSASDKVDEYKLKHNLGQNELLEKQEANYQERKDKTDTANQSIVSRNNTHLNNKLRQDSLYKAINIDTKGKNFQNFTKGLQNRDELERTVNNMFEYNEMAKEAGRYQDVLNKISSEPYISAARKIFDEKNKGVNTTDDDFKNWYEKEYLKPTFESIGFNSKEDFEAKAALLRERLNTASFLLQSMPKNYVSVKKSGGVISFLKKGGKHPDVIRYESQMKREIKSIEQLYDVIHKGNDRLLKSIMSIEKEISKLNKVK